MKTFKDFMIEAKLTQKQHIQNYTDRSRPLTRALYQHHKDGTTPPKIVHADDQSYDLDALDDISRKNTLNKNMKLYSGVRYSPMDSADEQGMIHLPAYTSTSESQGIAEKFALRHIRQAGQGVAHVLRFNMKKRDFAGNIAKKSAFGKDNVWSGEDEKEWLLPRNTKIKVNPVPEVKTHTDGTRIHIWDVHPQ